MEVKSGKQFTPKSVKPRRLALQVRNMLPHAKEESFDYLRKFIRAHTMLLVAYFPLRLIPNLKRLIV